SAVSDAPCACIVPLSSAATTRSGVSCAIVVREGTRGDPLSWQLVQRDAYNAGPSCAAAGSGPARTSVVMSASRMALPSFVLGTRAAQDVGERVVGLVAGVFENRIFRPRHRHRGAPRSGERRRIVDSEFVVERRGIEIGRATCRESGIVA